MTEEFNEQLIETPVEEPAGQSTEQPAQDLDQLKKELENIRELAKKQEELWKNEQRVNSRKEAELQRLKTQMQDRQASEETLKAMMELIAEEKGQKEEEFGETFEKRKPNLVQQWEKRQKELEAKRIREEYNLRANEVWGKATAEVGLTPDNEDYWEIQNFLKTGQIERAEVKINKLTAVKAAPPPAKPQETPKETEEERINRLVEEKLRQRMESDGLLVSETGTPSAANNTRSQLYKELAEGEMDLAKARKLGF